MSETNQEKWDRGRTLLLESLYKPDTKLRGCAYNQGCYDEMIALRDHVIELIKSMDRLHSCSVVNRKNGKVILSSISNRYDFEMFEGGDDHWEVIK